MIGKHRENGQKRLVFFNSPRGLPANKNQFFNAPEKKPSSGLQTFCKKPLDFFG